MTAEPNFVLDLTLALGCSAIGGYIAHRLKQPALLGYLVTGLIIGPFGLGLQTDVEQIQALAEVGIAFLLFALGVEFSLTELKRVKDIAIKGSFLQMGLTTLLVCSVSLLSGTANSPLQGIFLGLVLSLSSTAVVLKTLTDRGETATVHGQVMLGLLISQDIALGLMLAVLPVLNQPDALGPALAIAALKFGLFLAGAIALGRWVVPQLIQHIAATESSELFLLTVVALCLSIAWITSFLGLSIAMGAFVAGLMISEIDYADQALGKILPLRDTFACLFFASIGMLIDPHLIVSDLGRILELVALIMVGKALIILPIVLGFGYSLKTAVKASFGLNQIGEFSFVLALMGLELGLINEERYSLLLGTIAISLMLTPLWINLAPKVADWLHNLPVLKDFLNQAEDPKLLSVPGDIQDHVIVAGYGRVGEVLVNVLLSRGYSVLVIDNSETAIQRLRNRHAPLVQIPFVYGDADSELVLEKTSLETAKALAITLPDPTTTRLVLQRALLRAPELDIIARSHNNEEIDVLTQLGAREVVQPEFEAALELGSHLLNTLGEKSIEIQSVLDWIRQDRYRSIRPAVQVGEG
ncbi:MAG: cation:proton antiporter [Tildeniella torsiva UHER 1998/13D]|jgi:CPA2 family monovalent cation:H+ antiporter-2|nr:cation:proton antiporter [Tildeniella torsiva UHER 1998/13D]